MAKSLGVVLICGRHCACNRLTVRAAMIAAARARRGYSRPGAPKTASTGDRCSRVRLVAGGSARTVCEAHREFRAPAARRWHPAPSPTYRGPDLAHAAAVQVDLVHRRFPFTRSFVVPHGEERPCASRTMRPQTGPHPSRRRCAAPQDEGHSQSVQPPSTTWATPVVNALSSLAR